MRLSDSAQVNLGVVGALISAFIVGQVAAVLTREAGAGWVAALIMFGVVFWLLAGGASTRLNQTKDRENALRRWQEAPENRRIWVKEYNNAKEFDRDAQRMAANSWVLAQQSQGKNMGLGGAMVSGALFGMAGLMHGGKFTVTWVRPEGWQPATLPPVVQQTAGRSN